MQNMTHFLQITTIDSNLNQKQNVNEFEEKLKNFYGIGKRKILTKTHTKIDNDKTFYMHCLRFYMPIKYYKDMN